MIQEKNMKLPFTIIEDTREQTPFVFPDGVDIIRTCLKTGDYSIVGHEHNFTIERKSLSDLVGCMTNDPKRGVFNRDRFKRELTRMMGLLYCAVVIEGTLEDVEEHRYRKKIHPNSVFGSCVSWTMTFGVPFIFAGNNAMQKTLDLMLDYYETQNQKEVHPCMQLA